jgi:flagellar export protein FliJ
MAFHFALDPVVRFRQSVEDREQAALEKIAGELAQLSEALESAKQKIQESEAARVADLCKPTIGLHVHASYGEVMHWKQRRKDLEGQLKQLEQARDMQLRVYEAARRDREILTNMHDKQRAAYESDRTRREQKTLDDQTLARRTKS